MPRINLYVKKNDWKKFQEITDKPQWLHNAINNTDVSILTFQNTGKNGILTEENENLENPEIVNFPESSTSEYELDPEHYKLHPDDKTRAWDVENEEWVRVKFVHGKMVLNE